MLTRKVPCFYGEGNYEGDGTSPTALDLRKQIWWAAMSGACGTFFGNASIWPFGSGYASSRIDVSV